ncbi:ADOP family duplicated permease [Candidatus Zixiibacteriota bacterium]
MLSRMKSIVRTLFRGRRFRQELDEEMAFHIDQYTDDLIARGTDPDEARRRAKMEFGSSERVYQRTREARGVNMLDEMGRNVRFAVRSAIRNPLFTITFVVTLGLCIGAGTAVFSVVDAILWRQLPYPDSDRLALVVEWNEEMGVNPGYHNVTGEVWEKIRDNVDYMDLTVFSDWPAGVNLSTDDVAVYVQQQRVSAGFFRTLGIPPHMGREFTEDEDIPGGPPVVILSHDLWQQSFSSDQDIVGKTIRLKGDAYTVVGVMPEGMLSTHLTDLWTPLQPSRTGEGGGNNFTLAVRIPEGMTWAEADGRIRSIALEPSRVEGAPQKRLALVPMHEAMSAELRSPLLILFGAILIMLLVGGANLAGLQLARSVARRPEIATRQALGGGTGAIRRQMVVESIILGLLGGLAGLLVGYLSMGGLEAMIQTNFGTWQSVRLDGRAVSVALGLTLIVTILSGFAPVMQVRGFDLRSVLVSGGGRGIVGGSRHLLRKAFLVGEVALVTALLFSAGLLVRSFYYLDNLDPGFDSEGVLAVQLSMDDSRYNTGDNTNLFIEDSLREIQLVPGVRSAAVALTLPYERALNMPFTIEGVVDPEGEYRITSLVYVSPEFFETLGIPLEAGRLFEDSDRLGTPRVVITNQAFRQEHLTGGQEIGSRLLIGGSEEPYEVVGIVGNVQQSNAGWGSNVPLWASPVAYIPVAQVEAGWFRLVHQWFQPNWLLKVDEIPPGLGTTVTRIIQQVDPELPVARITPLDEVMAGSLARPRFEAVFMVFVAGFALLLAAVGLYGIVANSVVERTSEMGVRMALGASPRDAALTIGRSGLRLSLLGLAAGGILSAIVAPSVSHMVFGVEPYDPVTLGSVIICLGLITTLASFIPAFRVARLQPAAILREK